MAVVISLKMVYTPVDDTVTAPLCSTSTSTMRVVSLLFIVADCSSLRHRLTRPGEEEPPAWEAPAAQISQRAPSPQGRAAAARGPARLCGVCRVFIFKVTGSSHLRG